MLAHPARSGRTRWRFVLPAVVALALGGEPAAAADAPGERAPAAIATVDAAVQFRAILKLKVDILWQSARRRFAAARDAAWTPAAAPGTRRTTHVRPAPQDLNPIVPPSPRTVEPLATSGAAAIPANVRANNPALDGPGTGQAEESLAAWNDYVFVAWNDGQGFHSGGDQQGFGWSINGGASFTDGGSFPKPAGYPDWKWSSDPVVTVNEKTGRFFYTGLATSGGNNAIGLVSFRMSGAGPVFDPVRIVRIVPTATTFLDKPWMAADSAGTGRLYLTYTTFGATNWIDFQSSADSGATWSAPVQISDPADNGFVQGSRVIAGVPASPGLGRVHAVWSAIGQTTDEDFFRHRSSDDGGATWAAPVTPASFIANFGTGAPAFNRERGIHFPSLAIDRTAGPNRGRLYLTWNESYNHLNDQFNNSIITVESEPNGTPGQATPFAANHLLRGVTSGVTVSDFDYWSVPLNAGQHLIVWADSLPENQTYTLRLFAPAPEDGQRLAYGGDVIVGATVNQTYYTFTAPVSGTYLLRFAPAYTDPSQSVTGPYRLRTKLGIRGSERGRDQRDVFACWSDGGATWSTPVRVNDALAGYDEYLPEVAVGADGCPYVMWRDHRDDLHGSRTHQYVSKSVNGGVTWLPNQRLTDAQSNFSVALSNVAPNLGDYNALSGGARWLRAAWADGRDATVDVQTSKLDTDFAVSNPPAPQNVAPGQLVVLPWTITNHNALLANQYRLRTSANRNWGLQIADSLTMIGAGVSGTGDAWLDVPDSAAAGPVTVTLTTTDRGATRVRTLVTTVVVDPSLLAVGPVRPSLSLLPVSPNPARDAARIAFTLPADAHVRLTIHDPQGKRVRELVDGVREAGPHAITWDGRDARGEAAPPGAYFVRLDSDGTTLSQRVTWVR
jgi:hypothetical protein